MTETPVPDPIDAVIRSDHAAILDALAHLRTNTDPSATGELFADVCADIVRHFVAEEQYLLPALRKHLPDGDAIADASFAEHERIERDLRALDDDEDTTDERVEAAVGKLEAELREHVTHQESAVLPALAHQCDADELARLGEGMLGAEQLAPTHPRAVVFRSATLSKVASWLTGLVEKSIDAR